MFMGMSHAAFSQSYTPNYPSEPPARHLIWASAPNN